MTDSNVSTANPAGLKRYPVLIAGGGPVGLALAIELGWRGIHCLVVEQGDGTVDFPTTNLANTRTCEHLRRWGLADRMRYDSGYPTDYPRNYVFVTRMNGYEVARFDHPSPPPPLDHGLYVPSTWPGVRAPRLAAGWPFHARSIRQGLYVTGSFIARHRRLRLHRRGKTGWPAARYRFFG